MQNSAPITEQEIQQLETWLHSPRFQGRAMQIDRLQGFFAAVASSPDVIPPSVWLPEAVGGEPDYDSMEQAQEFIGLLMRYYNSVVAELFSSQPLTLRARAESAPALRPDYQSWCEGYIAGWSLSQEEWLRPGNGALKKLTFPILYLSGAFSEAQARDGKPYFADADQQQIEQDCIASLPQAVTDIFHFWLERRGPETVRRETPKVGRNETCPCGSGKKFKQCCGTERTLH